MDLTGSSRSLSPPACDLDLREAWGEAANGLGGTGGAVGQTRGDA